MVEVVGDGGRCRPAVEFAVESGIEHADHVECGSGSTLAALAYRRNLPTVAACASGRLRPQALYCADLEPEADALRLRAIEEGTFDEKYFFAA